MRTLPMLICAALMTASAVGRADPLSALADAAGNDPETLIRVGDLMVEAMRLKEAKKTYKQAQWRSKDNPEARLGIIRISMAENKFQQSKHYCRKLERAHPKSSAGDICSGLFWLGNERSSRAVEEFEKAVAKGDIVRGKTGVGDALSRAGSWDEAAAAYQEALTAGAGYEAHLGLGLTLEKRESSNRPRRRSDKPLPRKTPRLSPTITWDACSKPAPKRCRSSPSPWKFDPIGMTRSSPWAPPN